MLCRFLASVCEVEALPLCNSESFVDSNQLKLDDNFKFQSNKIHFDSIIIDELGVNERG